MNDYRSIFARADQGMALVLILIFTAALMVLGTALLTFAVNEKLIANYNTLDIRLYYIAEAGAEAGIALLQEEFNYSGDLSGSIGGGSYKVSFFDIDSYSRDVVSVGTLNGYDKTVTVTMALDGEADENSAVIRQWPNPNLTK